jgi:hypothetical protein
MRGLAPPILRFFGFRRVLVFNGLLTAASFLAYGLIHRTTPHWLIILVVAVGGFFRSLQFTSISALAYAELEESQLSPASTTSSMMVQLSQSIGVGLSAALLNTFMHGKGELQLSAETIAVVFVIMGLATGLSIFWFVRLPANAGESINGKPEVRNTAP